MTDLSGKSGSAASAGAAGIAEAHLRLRLGLLLEALACAVQLQTAENERLDRPDLTAFSVTTDEAVLALGRARAHLERLGENQARSRDQDRSARSGAAAPGPSEEQALRRRAAAAGQHLPMDALAQRFRLDDLDLQALLLVAAVELDRSWERAYAYVADDLSRRLPGIDVIVDVLSAGGADPGEVRHRLRPAGHLLRQGLIRPVQDVPVRRTAELVCAPGVLGFLLGGREPVDLLGDDPDDVSPPPGSVPPPQLGSPALTRLGRALGTGLIDLLGVWGGHWPAQRDAALAVAAAAGRPLRRLPPLAEEPASWPGQVHDAALVAADLGAVIWVPAGDIDEPAGAVLLRLLGRTRLPVVLTGAEPVRPPALLGARAFAEIRIPAPDQAMRQQIWAQALPGLAPGVQSALAARFRLSSDEIRAVASVAHTASRLADAEGAVEQAVATVLRGRSAGHVRAITPQRSMEELVLPPDQFQQVMEIDAAFRGWPRVAEAWGFARSAGDSGVRVLLTGEPGTGKTMTAEVLAGSAGLDLLRVDLSQVVSKWIGETEKNLEDVFRHAEESHAVLFFDEADALFGKRGDVRHGTDRYANLEIGYLLQRLEASDALVILASNLRENIDPAFTRRFHFAVHYCRPGVAERMHLWRIAFPALAPLAPDVELDALARLDLTGAGIVAAARGAALLAADAGEDTISMRDVVRGIARQYQREARLLRATDLGQHAHLLGPPPAPAVMR